MSEFSIGDTVKCIDQSSKYCKDTGIITDMGVGMFRVKLHFANKCVLMYGTQLELFMPATYSVNDRVEYFNASNNTTTEGTVVQVDNHNKVLHIIFDGDVLTSVMMMQSVKKILTAPTAIGSHYQPVIEEDPHTRITDEPENNPFEHTDLGSDLSGDELMDSIRSICGR